MENTPDTLPPQANSPPVPPPLPPSFPPVPSLPLSAAAQPPPAVIDWYKAYCVLSALLYMTLILVGILFFFIHPGKSHGLLQGGATFQIRVAGIVYILMGFLFMIPYLIGLFIPARPWGWIYGLIMICLSFNNCCCLPLSIPLLIFWIKPETQKHFGRMNS